ncbi:MAG: hypothetical protein MUF38_14650 [Anaerolineae bacterium]|jgi:uncharacterized membrane protein YesL|nr:hypothetical protein [Anaerolineae bacterium]
MSIFRVLRQSVQHLNHRGYIFIWANFLCLVCMLPIITAPAAWAGLTYLAHISARERQVGLEEFWAGLRANLWRGVVVALLNVVIVGINVTNLWAYANDPSPTTAILRPIWFSTLLVWFTLQLYMWPILHHMTEPTLLGAFRNAGIMLLTNPFFTLGVWLVLLVLWSVSTILAAMWLLLTLSGMALFLTFAVMDRLGVAGYSGTE